MPSEQISLLGFPAQEIARRKPVHISCTQLMCALLAEVQAQDFAHYAFFGRHRQALQCGRCPAFLRTERWSVHDANRSVGKNAPANGGQNEGCLHAVGGGESIHP